ncbi:MAG: hypothetical protein H6974_00860 [Gammaproteobacteria bacterium]|nr:hypothetical protein [Gammaproteobacteria bacterium]MCP5195337.1 hypothetical protein [Gammaproteobacteria bacterium]
MSDIEKIQIIHDIKETFNVSDSQLTDLVNQIENSDYKQNLDRFFRGYKIEDIYAYIQGSLPWVKLIHGLQQKQYPLLSKESYQVPDYLCIYEDSKKVEHPLFVEVKSVKGDKQSLELIRRQVDSLQTYANIMQTPLIIAVYWEKYGFWTHVPLDVFEEKTKKLKITLENAYKSDVSPIFGDISFVINKTIRRKTTYGTSNKEVPVHQKYGAILTDSISSDGINYIDISHIESAIIDAFLNMEVESENSSNDETLVIEKSKGTYVIKLSNLIIRHLGVFEVEPSFEYADFSRREIVEFLKKLDVTVSYGIPAVSKDITRKLYNTAFADTFVLNHFQQEHSNNSA